LQGGEFVSLMDPPPELQEAARMCKNEGTWPVLVGDEESGDRSTMLSSPIILYDYPKIAPESPGELFDGTEIDEILTLRVMTMTDAEKEEMRQTDERARQILERTESLPEERLLKMHGVVRELRSFDDDFFRNDRRLEVVEVNGVQLRAGDRVKIRPKSRADILDIALQGKTAMYNKSTNREPGGRCYEIAYSRSCEARRCGCRRQLRPFVHLPELLLFGFRHFRNPGIVIADQGYQDGDPLAKGEYSYWVGANLIPAEK
jgi:hypothetical protein